MISRLKLQERAESYVEEEIKDTLIEDIEEQDFVVMALVEVYKRGFLDAEKCYLPRLMVARNALIVADRAEYYRDAVPVIKEALRRVKEMREEIRIKGIPTTEGGN